MGKQWKQWLTFFFWAPKSLQMVISAMKLKDAYSLDRKSNDQPRQCIKKQRHYFASKGPSSQGSGFSSIMYGLRVGLWRKLSAEELMLLNCGVGEDSWESLGLQGDPASPTYSWSILGVHWKDWCWSWISNILATSCEELTHWKRLWCWEGLGAGGEWDDRGWDGWMASPTQWT